MKPTARRIPASCISRSVSTSSGCQLRMPTYTGRLVSGSGEPLLEALRLQARQLSNRRDAVENLVMVRHFLDSLGRHTPAAQHALEERTDIGPPLRAAERHNQNGLEPSRAAARHFILKLTSATRSAQSRARQSCREPERVLEPARIGHPLADDVEGRAVRGRREDRLQPGCDGDAFVEAKELRRNLTLVVIHHHDPVELPSFRPQKDRVRGQWSGGGDALPFELLERRTDDADLLVAEQAVLAAMRVQRGHANAWRSVAHRPQRRVGQPQRVLDAVRRDQIRRLRAAPRAT